MTTSTRFPAFRILLATCLFVVVAASCNKEETPLQPPVLTAELKAQLSAAADRVFAETATPGLIALIAVDGEPDFLIKRGTANLTTNEPMNEANAFRIASVTKTFTGTAILMLADEGLIDLDRPIADYLPEYNIPSGDVITIRMLGNMTSGLYNYSDSPELWEPFTASGCTMTFPPDSLLAIAFRHPMQFAPGTAYEYCNTNTILLGLLLEKVSQMPAATYIHEKICRPLNLNQTYLGGPIFPAHPLYPRLQHHRRRPDRCHQLESVVGVDSRCHDFDPGRYEKMGPSADRRGIALAGHESRTLQIRARTLRVLCGINPL